MKSRWLGLDIGGANLKAWCEGRAHSRPFELWKNPDGLVEELSLMARDFKDICGVAVTMTGELCDCFRSRQEGVSHIVDAVKQAFPNDSVQVYQTNGEFVSAGQAVETWRKTAAANWHAIAMSAMQFVPDQTGILIDIGSTTTDLIPFRNGKVLAIGKTDFGRMLNGELLYTGAQRSPVCAVSNSIEISGTRVLLAQEWFASMQDVYVLLGLDDGPQNRADTCDGRQSDMAHSMARLARSVCSDVDELGQKTVIDIARQIGMAHQSAIVAAIQNVLTNHPESAGRIIVAGQGEWLAYRLAVQLVPDGGILRLSELLDRGASCCAAAWAVSCLAEKFHGVAV